MHVYDEIRHTLTPIRATDRLSIREECHLKSFITDEPDGNGSRQIRAYVSYVYYCIEIRNGRRCSEMLHFISEADAQAELAAIVEAMKRKEPVYIPTHNTDKTAERTVQR